MRPNAKRREACMRYGRIKHEWVQHRLLCIPEGDLPPSEGISPKTKLACGHTAGFVTHPFAHLDIRIEQLKTQLKACHMKVVGSEIPVELDLYDQLAKRDTNVSRADLLVEYTDGPHTGQVATIEMKFGCHKLFQQPMTGFKYKTKRSHHSQASKYPRLWNASANRKTIGKCVHGFILYMEALPNTIKIVKAV